MEERKSYRFSKAWNLHFTFIRRFYPKPLTQSHLLFRLYIFFYQYVCFLGIEPTTFCAANAMLYHWATETLNGNGWQSFHFYVYGKIGDNALLIRTWKNVHLFLNCNLFRYKLSMCRMTMQTICCYYKKYICRIRSLNQNVKWFKVASVKNYIFTVLLM